MNHSEAMGNVAPPLQRTDAGIFARIRALHAQEAAVSRAMGEQPQPPLWVGVALITALSLIAGLWLIAVTSAVSGSDRTGITSPTSAEAAVRATGARQ